MTTWPLLRWRCLANLLESDAAIDRCDLLLARLELRERRERPPALALAAAKRRGVLRG